MSIMGFPEYIYGSEDFTQHLRQHWPDKAYYLSCGSDQIYLEEKVG